MGIKPHDGFGISMGSGHHREQHQIGQKAFQDKYNFNMMALAAEFRRRSPDTAMRDSLKLMEAENGNAQLI